MNYVLLFFFFFLCVWFYEMYSLFCCKRLATYEFYRSFLIFYQLRVVFKIKNHFNNIFNCFSSILTLRKGFNNVFSKKLHLYYLAWYFHEIEAITLPPPPFARILIDKVESSLALFVTASIFYSDPAIEIVIMNPSEKLWPEIHRTSLVKW